MRSLVQALDRFPDETPPEGEPRYEFVTVEDLTADEAADLRAAHLDLRDFLNGDLFGSVRMNRGMHAAHLDDLRARFTSGGYLPAGTDARRFATASLMNFTGSIHAYQEHSEIRAGRSGAAG